MKKPIGMDDPQKQEMSKRRNFTFRINLFFFFTFFLFSVLIVRLAMLQFVEGKELQAEKDKINKANTPIPPIRGNIYDRVGAPIAYTTSTQSLYFRIESDQPQDEVIALARKLADIFAKFGSPTAPQLTPENIILDMDVGYDLDKNKVSSPSYFSVPRRIKSGLTPDEMAYLLEHRDELKWIEIMEESIRLYDQETIAVQLVGYMRPFSRAREARYGLNFYKDKTKTEGYMDTEYVGYDGIELMYQEQLRGQNGMKSYPVNAQHKIIGPVEITKPVKGNNLFLTIDRNVQLTTEQAIMDHIKYLKSPEGRANSYVARGRNAVAGYAVAMEVDTGKVVAMASMPDYDPSVWAGGIPQSEYDRIQPYVNNGTITTAYPDYPTKEERDKHPTSIVYMGSVIKPLSVLIGLNEGLFTPSTRYPDTGVFTYGKDNNARLRNSDGKAWGMINATQAIQYSSNTFMSAMIGNALYMKTGGTKAIETWDQYLAKFGLGVLTGSGLPKEYEGLSEYKTNTRESPQQRMVFASWGQNQKYTTLQLAQFVTTLATRGERLQPLLVDRIETYEGQLVQKFDQKVVLDKSEFPQVYWDTVIKGMENVGVQGFADFPYKFARKTGTSTQVVGGREVDNAVFIAFAPYDKPKLAVAVVVPEGGFGSYGAAPIARKIFDAYDQKYGLDGVPKGAAGAANAQQ
ncbi:MULTISPECIES: penicillin-binding transpeptidase domain-containing protein [unclassified Paenibacillus]|uniref:peptidoglycan D,D-transpeptidase FtsI family protein n=1 Tax=unclassified Paenibacillus TaxID=185978 RepID=UPI001AE262FD|nr:MULTISPECIES: penicillin-binding transpeptidase domain-containing protein [unclassified Paenibacillus]MBP1154343.1 penicillin-binding protein 2 [Paenibacillus sp. PvP091]MBP1170273.1 penicillin-binding protein 2 [Paenibacillus sp. PvR098]MBP2441301.1 penicillin-binding protein 2 [Paenibacillus sp. PvP052]